MLIGWLEPPSARVQGDQVYRTRQPCADLAAFADTYALCGHWLDAASRKLAYDADVLVLAQCVDADLLHVVAERRRRGAPTVVEVNDNFYEPRAHGGAGNFYLAPERRALLLQLVAAADAVQVSTPYLGTLMRPHARRIEVFANAVQALPPLEPARLSTRHGLRLGWAGSAGHADDLAHVVPALRRLLDELPNATLAILAPEALRPLFAWVPAHRLDFRADGSLTHYLDFLRTLDVGLAPLCDTPFNRGRSDVKFLEYASQGACAVVQRSVAYACVADGVLGESFADNDELCARVRALAHDAARRTRLREAAYGYVARTRTRGVLAERRHAMLRALWQASAARSAAPPPAQRFAALAATVRAHATWLHPTRALAVGFAPQAAHLFNGLLAANGGDNKAATADFRAAVARAPDDYLGHLYLGHHADADENADVRAIRSLQRAQRLAPHAVSVTDALARRMIRLGQAAQAAATSASHTGVPLPYPPLLLVAHAARAARGDALAERLVPLWAALAAQLASPSVASALAREALEAEAEASIELLPAAIAALRRARHGGVEAGPCGDHDGRLFLLEAQLLHRANAWTACWRMLAPLCSGEPAPADAFAPDVRAALYALAAEAARRRGRPASARQLVRRAQCAAGASGRPSSRPSSLA